MAETQDNWLNSAYVSESPAKSAELNTAALAHARALQSIVATVDAIALPEPKQEQKNDDQ